MVDFFMWIFLNKTKNKIISNSFSTDSCLVGVKNPTYLPNRCSTSPSLALLQPQCSPWRGSSTTRESLRTRTFACAVLSGTLFSQTSYDLPLSAFRCALNCRLIFEALRDLTPPLMAYPISLILLHFPPHIYHHLICYTFIYYFYRLFLTLECKLHEGRDLVPFTDVSTVPRTVPNTQ